MNKAHLIKVIEQGENISVEFKRCSKKLNRDIFETVLAFLNRNGGHIFLGISDNGEILGVDDKFVDEIVNNFITICNNPLKLNPTYYFSPDVVEISFRKVIHIYIPESSQVHSTVGKIFDRNDDGDFNVTRNHNHVTSMYIRKQNLFTENEIYPYATLEDLRSDLFDRVKIRAKNENGGSHPWFELDNMELLKSAGLFKKDYKTGKEGITLGGILLFGKDETINNVLPHHKMTLF